MTSRFFAATVLFCFLCATAKGQIGIPQASPSPLADPTYSPETKVLFDLEARFAADVAQRGGAAFADWVAPDAVTLDNGKAAMVGREAVRAANQWAAKDNHLSWKPDGARLSPAGDMGFTWGSYTFEFRDRERVSHTNTGRYFTVWKKMPDGAWKVAMDGSNDAPPDAGSCCRIQ